MENDLKLIFPQVVLHNFGIEFNQLFSGDDFSKLRVLWRRHCRLAPVFGLTENLWTSACCEFMIISQLEVSGRSEL